MTQRTASDRLDLPEPFGPTMAVMLWSKVSTVFSGKDLKPWSISALRYMDTPRFRGGIKYHCILPHPRPVFKILRQKSTGKGDKKSRENSVPFSSFSLAKTFLMCYNQTKKLKILYKNRHFRQMNFPKISFFSCPSDWFPSLVVYRKGSDSNVLISPETIHVPLLTTSCIKIINKGALS